MQADGDFRVLVVDDHVDGADALADYLGALGWRVERAYSGPEALRMAARSPPDVVVLDVNMPGMDGHETARLLRDAVTKTMRIVGYTGSAMVPVATMGEDSGLDCIVSKGASMALLVSAVLGATM